MKPYTPEPLPPTDIDYGALVGLVGRANAELARYDGLLQGIVNPGVLLSSLTTQEAVLHTVTHKSAQKNFLSRSEVGCGEVRTAPST